jgi:hypothetical protein
LAVQAIPVTSPDDWVLKSEAALIVGVSNSAITDAIERGELRPGYICRYGDPIPAFVGSKRLFVPDVVEWKKRKVCPHYFKPMILVENPRFKGRPIKGPISPANGQFWKRPANPNKNKPRRSRDGEGPPDVVWFECQETKCRKIFATPPDDKPSHCPFCTNLTIRRCPSPK